MVILNIFTGALIKRFDVEWNEIPNVRRKWSLATALVFGTQKSSEMHSKFTLTFYYYDGVCVCGKNENNKK